MTEFGYHASHEQFPPRDLLDLAERAAEYDFDHVLASDHFHPWSERQGESGFVWSWLGAALERTPLSVGTVTAPGYRYHPAVVAQAAATLSSMYPGRFWLSVGSGEYLNEHVTGEAWPAKADRNARLRECVEVMRRLWDGETVTHDGRVTVKEATLYTRPESPPAIVGAALSTETARWLGEWADGMITIASTDHEALTERVGAFREEAPDAPVYLKVQLASGEDEESVVEAALSQWRTNCLPGTITENLWTTEQFDAVGSLVDESQLREHVRVSADKEDHVEWLRRDLDLDVDVVVLHDVTPDQDRFVEEFGRHVLPELT